MSESSFPLTNKVGLKSARSFDISCFLLAIGAFT